MIVLIILKIIVVITTVFLFLWLKPGAAQSQEARSPGLLNLDSWTPNHCCYSLSWFPVILNFLTLNPKPQTLKSQVSSLRRNGGPLIGIIMGFRGWGEVL